MLEEKVMERCEKVTPAPKINMSQHEPRKTPDFSSKDGQWDVNMTDGTRDTLYLLCFCFGVSMSQKHMSHEEKVLTFH